jgi:hypothetical protein
MFKLSSIALGCAICSAALIGTAVDAEAKKGSFARGVGIGVGVSVAKQVMRPNRDKRGTSESGDNDASATGMMLATPVANTGRDQQPNATKPSAAQPYDPATEGTTVCVAGCYQ